jgi:nitroimidazol reductase NimA-like FMN-containing flavoprotein (pyridoxamine 5'-phosphate oxidase superfamily)
VTRVADAGDNAARAIIDGGRYLTVATADANGVPWASPVWYAPHEYREFLWVSRPAARHSRNIAARPQVGLVIFDSTVPPGTGQAVYADAVAEELPDSERERSIAIYSRRSQCAGAGEWRPKQVSADAPVRIYRARVERLFVVDGDDRRVPIAP